MTAKKVDSPTAPPTPLVAAVRGFVAEAGQSLTTLAKPKQVRPWTLPQYVLVFDTETTTDPSQRLLFGVFRLCRWVVDRHGATVLRVVEEGLIHDDGLDEWNPDGYAVLREYARWKAADTARGCSRIVTCRSREEFIREVFLPFGFRRHALIVGFNLPFDLSRVAADATAARGQGDDHTMWGGWSLRLRIKSNGKDVGAVPRILVQHINKNLAFFRFTAAEWTDWSKGKDRPRRPTFRGHFLDLKTLCFALSDRSYSLRDAGTAFRARFIKPETPELGAITDETITYCRDDVHATQALLEAVLAEYQRHPIGLAPWEVHSPATIAKGYLRAMGIPPFLSRVDGISAETLGQAHSAYFGGRTETRIRHEVVPVMVLDYTATYPAVHILLHTQEYLTADRLRTEDCTAAARDALARITPDAVCDRAMWPELRFFAEVEPDGDVLPVRAQYRSEHDTYNVAVNPVTSDRPLWYAGPDLAASILLSGKQPTIRRAFRLVADGTLDSLRPVRYRGELTIDPRPGRHDIFQRIVEERYRVKASALPEAQLEASERGLKVISTAGSYGVMAQFTEKPVRRRGKSRKGKLAVHAGGEGINIAPRAVEQPGEYCFPPVAALITSGARLLLALAERLVADRGGAFLTMDTDSIFVVASEHGGWLPCPGGSASLDDGRSGVRVLSWAEVQAILDRIDQLKPYGAVVTDSLLKVEKVNREGKAGPLRQLHGLAIAAKRYCVFTVSPDGRVTIVKSSRHGLGTLLDPSGDGRHTAKGERDDPDRGWLAEVWRRFVARALGRPEPTWPIWVDRLAVVRFTASSPRRLRPFLDDLKTQPYANRIKPFNFMLVPYIRRSGTPDGADPIKSRLVTAYQRDASQWREAIWRDLYGNAQCRVTTGDFAGPNVAMVKTVRIMIEEYWTHPESKSLAPDGSGCFGLTRGLLGRQPVAITGVVAIGKEASGLSDLEDNVVATAGEVQHIYRLPAASQWDALVRPRLAAMTTDQAVEQLARRVGVHSRTVRRWKQGAIPRGPARTAVLRWARGTASRSRTRRG